MEPALHSCLPRLAPSRYHGNAVVHWTLSSKGRAQGWLDARFHFRFREIMLHTCVREHLLCPAYCLMPDHMHFIWIGLGVDSDQQTAMGFLRTYLNKMLIPWELDHQSYDHVLRADERQQNAFARMCIYILNNPVRAGLVTEAADWAFMGAIIPGYPKLNTCNPDYWTLFWKFFYKLRDKEKNR